MNNEDEECMCGPIHIYTHHPEHPEFAELNRRACVLTFIGIQHSNALRIEMDVN